MADSFAKSFMPKEWRGEQDTVSRSPCRVAGLFSKPPTNGQSVQMTRCAFLGSNPLDSESEAR
jgi:hypothetical protein